MGSITPVLLALGSLVGAEHHQGAARGSLVGEDHRVGRPASIPYPVSRSLLKRDRRRMDMLPSAGAGIYEWCF